jgi:hypothetical protein
MTEPSIPPELDRLITEINQDRDKRRIEKIKYALENYLIARQEKELQEAKEKTWRYRIAKFFREGLTAH